MKLMTKELEKKFEKYPLYSQDGMGGKAKVLVKYFNPVGAGTWLITEGNKLENGDYEMFGYCHLGDDDFAELGYVMLSELENITLFGGLKIERDLYLNNNITLYDAMKKSGMKIPDFLNVNLKKELNVNSLINNFEVPLVIEEYLDLSLDDLENDLYLKKYVLIVKINLYIVIMIYAIMIALMVIIYVLQLKMQLKWKKIMYIIIVVLLD